jgi:membrane protein implicated in regulation of membrane protease activity
VGRRARFLWFGACAVLIVTGGLCAALVSGTLGQVLAFVLIALALVGLTSLVFLEVGLSEDRARAREERGQRPAGGFPPRRPRRLDRRRGQRRRLR